MMRRLKKWLMVKKMKNHASAFINYVFNDDVDDFGTKIELEIHKEHPEHVTDDDEEIEKEKKDEEVEKEKKDVEIEKEKDIFDDGTGSTEIQKEQKQTPNPLSTRSLRNVSSSDKTVSEELTATISLTTTTTSKDSSIIKRKKDLSHTRQRFYQEVLLPWFRSQHEFRDQQINDPFETYLIEDIDINDYLFGCDDDEVNDDGIWEKPNEDRVNLVCDENQINDDNIKVVPLSHSYWKSTMADALHQYLAGLALVDRLALDYGLHPLNIDADVLEMAKYIKDYKIILVYVKHGSSIFVTTKKGISIALDNHLRKGPIEIDSSPDITGNEITGKQMVIHVGNSSTVDDVLNLEMLFKIERVGPVGKFKEVGLIFFMISCRGEQTKQKRGPSQRKEDVHEDDLDVIDYDSFSSNLEDGIDSERRIQLRELRRIGKHKNKGFNKVTVRCEGIIPALVHYVAIETDVGKNEFSQTKGGPVIKENNTSGKHNILGKDKTCHGKGKKVFLDHIIKSLATNLDIPVRAVQNQMLKQFDMGVSKMKGTIVRIDIQQERNPKSMTRTFRRVYVCLGALKQGFRACGRESLRLDGCFMSGPCPGQILTEVRVDANNGIYPVAYAIVEAERKREYLMKRIVVVQKVIARTVGPLTPFVTKLFDAIKKGYRVHYSMEWREMWPVVKATTVIVPPLYKPQVGRPARKSKKSHDEIENEICSSGKLSRKGKSVRCGKCGNMGHDRKGCRGQGGATQADSSGSKNVFGQGGARRTARARNLSGHASAR
uniref:Transposase, mutator type n=1 Tax=Tanacetum cinerariifolium TaxID=118510 RepID=A0A6L2P5Z8_TANCI|nr:transposase, mutator type [Tanacetum cinerariifolium]